MGLRPLERQNVSLMTWDGMHVKWESAHLGLAAEEESAADALVAVVGLRGRGSWRRLETPASFVPLNEELGLLCLELLEKLCLIEFDDLNILVARLPLLDH